MDVMHQQPIKKRKANPAPKPSEKQEDDTKGATSIAQTEGYIYFYCKDKSCRLQRYGERDKLSKEDWLKPNCFDKYQESKKEKKHNHTHVIWVDGVVDN